MEFFLKFLIFMGLCMSLERYYCVEYEYVICFRIMKYMLNHQRIINNLFIRKHLSELIYKT